MSMKIPPDYFGLMPVKKISREEARAMWPSEAEARRRKIPLDCGGISAIIGG
jgi:hypothetical protein